MPRLFRIAVAALLLSLLTPACGGGGGGGGEGTPTEPIFLMQAEATWRGGRSQIMTNVGIGMTHLDTMGDTFYELFADGAPWTPGDVGATRIIRAGDTPAFALFADQATNGVNEALYFRFASNGAEAGGNAGDESVRWGGGFNGTLTPDAAGYILTHVECELTQETLDVPGDDPNQDGIYTNYDVRWIIRVYGYRAP